MENHEGLIGGHEEHGAQEIFVSFASVAEGDLRGGTNASNRN